MGKLPIYFKAYDNRYKIPMHISLFFGLSLILSFQGELEFWLGLGCIALFLIFKYLNYKKAKEEVEEIVNARTEYEMKEINQLLNNKKFSDENIILRLAELSKAGNRCATILLAEIKNGGDI